MTKKISGNDSDSTERLPTEEIASRLELLAGSLDAYGPITTRSRCYDAVAELRRLAEANERLTTERNVAQAQLHNAQCEAAKLDPLAALRQQNEFLVKEHQEAVVRALRYHEEAEKLRQSQPFCWIPLSERKPTKEDGDKNGSVLWAGPIRDSGAFKYDSTWFDDEYRPTHWSRIPALPVPKVKAQEELDEEAFNKVMTGYSNPSEINRAYWLAALKHARQGKETQP